MFSKSSCSVRILFENPVMGFVFFCHKMHNCEIFSAGGHGIIYDGPNDETFKALGNKFLAEGKVVSAVCHGPAGLVNFHAPDGTSIFKGKKVSLCVKHTLCFDACLCFSN